MKPRFSKILLRTAVVAASLLLAACAGDDAAPAAGQKAAASAPASMARTPSPPGASVFFITPGNGDTVTSPVTVKFGISGMSVAPAGDATAASGHHHLLIDAQLEDFSLPVPSSDNYRHFGKGQTETTVELPAGTHTLQLVLGDANHVPHEPPVVSGQITIIVE